MCVLSLSLSQARRREKWGEQIGQYPGGTGSAFSGGILTFDVTYTHSCAPSERIRPYVQFHRPPDRIWINLQRARDTSTRSVIGIRGASGPLAAPAFVLRASAGCAECRPWDPLLPSWDYWTGRQSPRRHHLAATAPLFTIACSTSSRGSASRAWPSACSRLNWVAWATIFEPRPAHHCRAHTATHAAQDALCCLRRPNPSDPS